MFASLFTALRLPSDSYRMKLVMTISANGIAKHVSTP